MEAPKPFIHDLHDRIQAALTEKFKPPINEIGVYWPFDEPRGDAEQWEIRTPAILLEMESIDVSPEEPGDGRKTVVVNLALHCLLSTKTPDVDIEIRNFAFAVLTQVHDNRWGLPCRDALEPDDVAAVPSTVVFDKPGFEGWSVVWSQTFYTGASVFDGEGVVPDSICFSFAPNIGADHEADYQALT